MPFQKGNTIGERTRFKFRGGKKKLKCELCGKEFEVYPSEIRKRRRFCSGVCSYKAHVPRLSRRRRITKECEVCGMPFEVLFCKKEKRRFCSNECKGQNMKNPNRLREQAFYSSSKWTKIRRAVYKRDKYICQRCGNGPEAGKRVAHHLDEISKSLEINWLDMSRIITLCIPCHNKIHQKFIKNNPRKGLPS